MNGMGSHQSARMLKDEWLTPPEILKALGRFDLDPCAPVVRPWPMAENHHTINDDGLSKPWTGRVWLNPPYGQQTGKWLAKLKDHGNGIALTFARTETAMFFNFVWPEADGLLFLRGRPHFHHVDGRRASGNSGAPVVLIAYGEFNANKLEDCDLPGQFIRLREPTKEME
jgi:hypothetical protein